MKKYLLLGLLLMLTLTAVVWANPVRGMKVGTLSGPTGLAMVKLLDETGGAELEVFKSPDLVVGKLVTGELDAAALPMNLAAVLYNKGADLKVASVFGWGVMYVVSSDSKLKHWKDLKGKEVYVASKGAVSDLLLRYLSSKNGLNLETELKIQYSASPVEVAQLLIAGKIQTAVLPEPWVTQVMLKNSKLKIRLDYQKEWQRLERQGLTYPQSCLVVRGKYAAEHPEAVKGLLKDLQRSIGWVQAHRKEAGSLAEKYVQIAPETVVQGLSRCNLKYTEAFKVRRAVDLFLQRLLEYAPEAVGGRLPDENFYYQP